MSAPVPGQVSKPELTLDEALVWFNSLTQDDHGAALPLFLLLRGVVDPNGDKEKFRIADEIMRRAIVRTPQFEEWYQQQLVA